MNNNKIVIYVCLILTLVVIYCHALARGKDWQDIRLRNEGSDPLPKWLEQFVNKRGCRPDGSVCVRDSNCCGLSNCLSYGFFRLRRCGLYGSGGSYNPGDLNRSRSGHSRCGGDGHRCGRK